MDNMNIWKWGLDEARERHWDLIEEPAMDAEDLVVWGRVYLEDGEEEAWDLQYELYGDSVLCYCGCGRIFPPVGSDYDRWAFECGSDHLKWLYCTVADG